ncbi:MAG TPA: methyltransferase domain-containing protein [Nitrolancea sp.]|nr:methyltransferase domain-containing protein [Nitrolancea sp.]
MKRVLSIIMALGALVVVVSLVWRRAVEQRNLPCPSWLSWVLGMPSMGGANNPETILDRLDLQPGMHVLDVGAGSGRIAIPAARRVEPGGEVAALDIQPTMLRKLEQRAAEQSVTNVRSIEGGIGGGLLPHDAFDRALLKNVLGEISDRDAALREISAALKPGGVLSITEIFPDPHFQPKSKVREMTAEAGFCPGPEWGGRLAYTLNVFKPVAERM